MDLEVTLYTRQHCGLCEDVKRDLRDLQAEIPHKLIEVDIESDPTLLAEYDHRIPVISVGPYTLEPPIDQVKLRMTLNAAKAGLEHRLEDHGEKYRKKKEREQKLSGADKFSGFISKNLITIILVFLFVYFSLPFAAPVLMKAGYSKAAQPIYSAYAVFCHRLAFRSWFLFGDQFIYPRAAADLEGFTTYGEATGFSEDDLWTASRFQGNEQMGYKVPFCQRDVAIYASMFLFGIFFLLTGKRIKSLNFWLWAIIGVGPIALDGFSQLVSQTGGVFSFIAYRESTPLLRTLTGVIFGIATAWFGFPVIEETMAESRRYLAEKKARVQGRQAE